MNLTKSKVSFGRGTKTIDQVTNAGMVYFNTGSGEIYLNGVTYGGNFKNLDDALIESGEFDPENNTLTFSQKGGDEIVVNLSLASDKANGLMSSTDWNRLNGADTVAGSVSKEIKDAKDAAIEAAETLVGELGDYADVAAMIEGVAAEKAKAVADDLAEHTGDEDIHVTADQKADWDAAKKAIDAFLKDAELDAEGVNVLDTLAELQTMIGTDPAAATLISRVKALEDDHVGAVEYKATDDLAKANAAALEIINDSDSSKEGSLAKTKADAVSDANDYTDEALSWWEDEESAEPEA